MNHEICLFLGGLLRWSHQLGSITPDSLPNLQKQINKQKTPHIGFWMKVMSPQLANLTQACGDSRAALIFSPSLTHPQIVLHSNEGGKIRDFQLYSLTNWDSNLHFKTTAILKRCQKQSIFAGESQKIFVRFISSWGTKEATPSHETARSESKREQNPAALKATHLKRDQSRAFLRWGISEVQTLPLEAQLKLRSWSTGFTLRTADTLEKNRLCSCLQPALGKPGCSNGLGPTSPLGLPGHCSHYGCEQQGLFP